MRVYAPKSEWTTTDPDAEFRRTLADTQESRRKRAAIEAKYCTGGELRIGIDGGAAIRAWCFPAHTNTTETLGGMREQWVYRDRGYLYFENGRLVAIQRSN